MGERSLQERLARKESLGVWDENVYWHTGGSQRLRFFGRDLAQWQALGLDQHSRIADPQSVNPAAGGFRLKRSSPALQLGFHLIDLSRVGLYGDKAWINEARRVRYTMTITPPPPPMQ